MNEKKELEYKQLDSHDRFDIFGEPSKRSQNSNVLPLI